MVKELTSRFAKFQKTGDESSIPPDLQRITYATVRFFNSFGKRSRRDGCNGTDFLCRRLNLVVKKSTTRLKPSGRTHQRLLRKCRHCMFSIARVSYRPEDSLHVLFNRNALTRTTDPDIAKQTLHLLAKEVPLQVSGHTRRISSVAELRIAGLARRRFWPRPAPSHPAIDDTMVQG